MDLGFITKKIMGGVSPAKEEAAAPAAAGAEAEHLEIKEEVGYPAEAEMQEPAYEEPHEEMPGAPAHEDVLEGMREAAAPEAQEVPLEESGMLPPPEEEEIPLEEEAVQQPLEYPSFLPPPMPEQQPTMEAGLAQEDVEAIVRNVTDEIRKEFEEKIKDLSEDLDELKKIENEIEKMHSVFERLSDKYKELAEKMATLPTQSQEDLKEIKATIGNINQIMSSALPALIKEVREIKGQK